MRTAMRLAVVRMTSKGAELYWDLTALSRNGCSRGECVSVVSGNHRATVTYVMLNGCPDKEGSGAIPGCR
jgi:hypothetical protein